MARMVGEGGTRHVGKGSEMGRVAWEGRPHYSTTVVRVRGRRGQRWQGAVAEFELLKLVLKQVETRSLETWSVHAQTTSI